MILGSSVWCSKFYLPCMGRGTGVYMQEAHVHAGTEEVLCPLGQDSYDGETLIILLEEWNETIRKSMLEMSS